MMEKAAASPANEVMLDLEDAVAPDEKEDALDRIVLALSEFDWDNTVVVAVRINGLNHPTLTPTSWRSPKEQATASIQESF